MTQKNTTINSALESMRGSFMPMNDPIVSLLTRLLTSGTGLMGTVWNAPGTPNSMYLSSIDEHLKELNRKTSDLGKDLVITQAANVAFRSMYPTAPDSVIDSKVQGLLGTGFQTAAWRLGGTLLNFGEMNQIGEGLGAVASNVAKAGLGRGDWSGFRLGKLMAEGLFADGYGEDGRLNVQPYSSSDWFGFSQAGVSTLAGLLTSRLDVTSGLSGSGPDAVKAGVDKLKSLVRNYAEVLAPLQDVFGSDMKSIVTTLEKLSGSSITGIGSGTLGYLSTELSARIASGEYNLSGEMGYMNMNSVMHGMLARTTGLSPYMYRAGGMLALSAGDMFGGTGDNAPSFTTRTQWLAGARDYAFSSGTSEGADALSKIYVLGLKRRNRLWSNEEEFNRHLQRLTARGQDAISAGMQLVGAVSITDLDRAMQYTEYQESVEQGVGSRSAMLHRAAMTARLGASAARVDEYFKEAVGASGNDALSSRRYQALLGLVREDSSLLSLAGKDRERRLKELQDKNPSLFAGMSVEQAMHGLQYAQSSDTYMRTGLTVANLVSGAADVRKKAALAAKRQKAYELLMPSLKKDWQTIFKDGISLEALNSLATKDKALEAAISMLNKDNRLGTVLDVAQNLTKVGLSEGQLSGMIGYSTKLKSMTGGFQLALEDYEKLKSQRSGITGEEELAQHDAKIRAAAERMFLASGGLSEDSYSRLMSMDFYTSDGIKLKGDALELERNKFIGKLVEDPKRAGFKLQSKYLENRIYSKDDTELRGLFDTLNKEFVKGNSSADRKKLSQVGYFREYIEDNRKTLNKEYGEGTVNQLERMIKDALQMGTGGKVTEMTEFIRILEDLKPILKSIAQGLPAKPELNSSSK